MINNVVEELIQVIEALEGSKTVTLLDDESNSWRFNFTKDGKIGIDESQENLLRNKLAETLRYKGSIVIRQHTELKKGGIPINKIYGVYLHNNDWSPIPAEDMEYVHNNTGGTRDRLPIERNVVFASLQKSIE